MGSEWTKEQIDILKTKYIQSGVTDELLKELYPHSKYAVWAEISKLGISRKGLPQSTFMDSRVGEEKIQNCGLVCRITGYRNAMDIDVFFLPNGPTVKSKQYSAFIKGQIKPKNVRRISSAELKAGDVRLQKNGMKAEVVRILNKGRLEVKFEDGTVVMTDSIRFCAGHAHHPKKPVKKDNVFGIKLPVTVNDRVCKNFGHIASALDIDYTVLERKFAKGMPFEQVIEEVNARNNSEKNINNKQEICTDHLGNVYKNTKEKCKAYGIGIGTYYKRKGGYGWSEKDALTLPKGFNRYSEEKKKERIGKVYPLNCGMHVKIESFLPGSCEKCIARFVEDPSTSVKTDYNTIIKGELAHPKLNVRHSGSMLGFINVKKIFVDGENALFGCTCKICGKKDIITIEQMKKHQKDEHGKDYNDARIPTPRPDDLIELVKAKWPNEKDYKLIMKRVIKRLKNGWSLEEAINAPPIEKYQHAPSVIAVAKICYDHLGNKFVSENARAEAYGLNVDTIRDRLKYKWGLEKALTTPAGAVNAQHMPCVDHEGREFKTRKAMAEYWKIPEKTLLYRLNHGWKTEDALTTPVCRGNKKRE